MAIVLASVIGSDSHRQRDRGRQPDPRGDRGGGRERDPRVERAQVAVVGQRLVAGARVGGVALDRDVGVLGHVERVEATLLGGVGGVGRRDAAVGGEQDDAVAHPPMLERVTARRNGPRERPGTGWTRRHADAWT